MKRERERKREKEECMKSFTKVSPCSTFFFSLSALFPFCSALEHALIHLLNTPCGRILKRKKNGKGKLLFFFPLFCFLSFSLEWNHCALFMRSVEREIERERERERGRPQTHFPLHCLAESAALFALFALFTFALKNTFQAIFARRDSCICWHLIRCYSPSPPPP